jgi:D-beta-D-heptose 7-phosphate kinase/D-beta-D-heptose 1-phosphate adenosyltransferase
VVTPNHHEAELMTGITIRTPDDARRAARQIHDRTGANVLITWGEHGMWLLDASGEAFREEGLAASAREVADVTGAGDTVLALLALSLAAGASLSEAARLANVAAGLVVARFGPAVVGVSELATAVGTMAQ